MSNARHARRRARFDRALRDKPMLRRWPISIRYSSIDSAAKVSMTTSQPRFIDIGVNLTDPVFRGKYHGKQAHQDDFDIILSRAHKAGVVGQILTGGNLQESKEALQLASRYDGFYSTVGCHPTRTSEMEDYPAGPSAYLSELSNLIASTSPSRVVAIGECGLDYDRLHFSPADVQRRHFASQLDLSIKHRLPLFLHSRAAHADFVEILKPRIDTIHSALIRDHETSPSDVGTRRVGVVHSFTGTIEEARELLQMGLFIGINGCSLKTQENLDVLHHIPLSRLMLETDAPWCDPRSTHASASHIKAFEKTDADIFAMYQPKSVKKEKWTADTIVKGRNEPCVIGLIAATVASVKNVTIAEVADAAKANTEWLFGVSL